LIADFARRDVTLENWRTRPYSTWAFQNVQELVPSAAIRANARAEDTPADAAYLLTLEAEALGGRKAPIADWLSETEADSLVVMKGGKFIFDWHAPHRDPARPHIIFSVSKSLTGLLAGALAAEGAFSPDEPVTRYIREAAGSAFGDASLRQLLDMQVSVDFIEDYLDRTGAFDRYRRATGWNPAAPGETPGDLLSFICTIGKGEAEHGLNYTYRSPDTDLMGIVLERAGGARFHDLLSRYLWQPMGAASDAEITVDRIGTARAAGGISVTARDMARVGELVRLNGAGVIPESWIADMWTGGSPEVWQRGGQTALFPKGAYRSFWYATGEDEMFALGIHGQWIWIDPAREVVIAKQSSQSQPISDPMKTANVASFRQIARAL
jgi:CubicO group peptidase (beta-lactamase class C family)